MNPQQGLQGKLVDHRFAVRLRDDIVHERQDPRAVQLRQNLFETGSYVFAVRGQQAARSSVIADLYVRVRQAGARFRIGGVLQRPLQVPDG
jgi:hypothetical protein